MMAVGLFGVVCVSEDFLVFDPLPKPKNETSDKSDSIFGLILGMILST
jgi:hypothetical protein